MNLSNSQFKALEYFAKQARIQKSEARETIDHILRMSNISADRFERAVHKLKQHARVALHFHPDRPDDTMKSVAEALFEQGMYKSQFETRISNGSVSAFSGGERDLWEQRLFGGAYQLDGTTNAHRPKYGALNVMHHPDGPAPRFGSCYFLLKPEVSRRSTYTYLDSHQDPKEKGTWDEFDAILAALLKDSFLSEFALGEHKLKPPKLMNHLENLEKPFGNPANKEPYRNLNHYIEAQVHGEISLNEDVEILVADPSFKNRPVGKILQQICKKYSIVLCWHRGFILLAEEVPSDFRGPLMPSLAKRIAQDGRIDASIIGRAVMDLKRHPDSWSDRGTHSEVLQELKLLWHVLVRYGK